jgi:hypothetical protein
MNTYPEVSVVMSVNNGALHFAAMPCAAVTGRNFILARHIALPGNIDEWWIGPSITPHLACRDTAVADCHACPS